MRKYFSLGYLQQIGRWLWHGRFHLLTFIAVIVAIFYITGGLKYYPTMVSALLSITGLLIILTQQILDAREFADYRPNTIFQWVKSFPNGKSILIIANGILGVSSTLKARAIVSLQANATTDEKLNFLIQQLGIIQDNIANIDDRVDQVTSSLTKRSEDLESELDKMSESLKTIIAGHIIGAYDVNLFGVMITICGTLIQLFAT